MRNAIVCGGDAFADHDMTRKCGCGGSIKVARSADAHTNVGTDAATE